MLVPRRSSAMADRRSYARLSLVVELVPTSSNLSRALYSYKKNLLYGGFFIVVIPTRLSATLLRNACSTALIGYGRPAFLRPPFACSRTRPHEFKSLSGSLQLQKKPPLRRLFYSGDPNEIRTRVTAVRGRCPRPLDDGTITSCQSITSNSQNMQALFRHKSAQAPITLNFRLQICPGYTINRIDKILLSTKIKKYEKTSLFCLCVVD